MSDQEDRIPTYIETPTGQAHADEVTMPESGRKFRDAWRLEGDALVVDMEEARDIARDEIRRAREPKLRDLDIAYQRATEGGIEGANTASIIEQKQRLRDYPADARLDVDDDAELAANLDAILAEIEEM